MFESPNWKGFSRLRSIGCIYDVLKRTLCVSDKCGRTIDAIKIGWMHLRKSGAETWKQMRHLAQIANVWGLVVFGSSACILLRRLSPEAMISSTLESLPTCKARDVLSERCESLTSSTFKASKSAARAWKRNTAGASVAICPHGCYSSPIRLTTWVELALILWSSDGSFTFLGGSLVFPSSGL